MEETKDDGSLACLKIPIDKDSTFFNCRETSQQKILNTTFWVVGFITGVKTIHGPNRYIVKIKQNKDDPESAATKFFTNSADLKYVLDKLKELDKLPRRVTLRASGNRYYFE